MCTMAASLRLTPRDLVPCKPDGAPPPPACTCRLVLASTHFAAELRYAAVHCGAQTDHATVIFDAMHCMPRLLPLLLPAGRGPCGSTVRHCRMPRPSRMNPERCTLPGSPMSCTQEAQMAGSGSRKQPAVAQGGLLLLVLAAAALPGCLAATANVTVMDGPGSENGIVYHVSRNMRGVLAAGLQPGAPHVVGMLGAPPGGSRLLRAHVCPGAPGVAADSSRQCSCRMKCGAGEAAAGGIRR